VRREPFRRGVAEEITQEESTVRGPVDQKEIAEGIPLAQMGMGRVLW